MIVTHISLPYLSKWTIFNVHNSSASGMASYNIAIEVCRTYARPQPHPLHGHSYIDIAPSVNVVLTQNVM